MTVCIESSRSFVKNTLKAFIDVTVVEIGLTIRGATLHEKDGSRWISLPSKPYEQGGETKWQAILEFDSRESRDAFNTAALAAWDRHTGGGR